MKSFRTRSRCALTVCVAIISFGFHYSTLADIVAATLPSSRSVQIDNTATAFATIINLGNDSASACSVALPPEIDADFAYQTTDANTNQPVGLRDIPIDLGPGDSQSFVFGITPLSQLAAQHVRIVFQCESGAIAASVPGLNTLLLSASSVPVPDVIALAKTVTNDGILSLPGSGDYGFFAASTINVGDTETLEVTSSPTFSLDGSIVLCESDSSSGSCLATPAEKFETTISKGQAKTFSIFVRSAANIPLDPATNRIDLEFRQLNCSSSDSASCDEYEIRGSTSVAITSDLPNRWDANTWGSLLWQ